MLLFHCIVRKQFQILLPWFKVGSIWISRWKSLTTTKPNIVCTRKAHQLNMERIKDICSVLCSMSQELNKTEYLNLLSEYNMWECCVRPLNTSRQRLGTNSCIWRNDGIYTGLTYLSYCRSRYLLSAVKWFEQSIREFRPVLYHALLI